LCFLFFFFFFFLIFFNETPPLRIKDMWWVVTERFSVVGCDGDGDGTIPRIWNPDVILRTSRLGPLFSLKLQPVKRNG
jgi:hypothetical protein